MAVVVVVVFGGLFYLRAWPPAVVVMSNSMEPAIETGSIVLVRQLDGPPEVGDVVKVPVPAAAQATGYPKEVMHRVIEITEDGLVRTQGDNLDKPDPFAVPVSVVTERAVTVIPGAGELISFLFSPYGLLWIAAGVLLLVVMPFFDGQRELKLAVSEYGYHLRSHTQILQSMSAASQDLAATTEKFRETIDPPVDVFDGIDIPDWVVAPPTPVDPSDSWEPVHPLAQLETHLEWDAEKSLES